MGLGKFDGSKTILVTGSSGFIGKAICGQLQEKYKVIAIDKSSSLNEPNSILQIAADIGDQNTINQVVKKYVPDVVIHCAGIAHQKVTRFSLDDYLRINSHSTEFLANSSVDVNPNVHFIFLSSISVYGEAFSPTPVSENNSSKPSSDYALSKLDAEIRLIELYKSGVLKKLDILRLAPVYDKEWSLNLERRVFAPKKMFYLKFGSGNQEMSALSRSNLVDFIDFEIELKGGREEHMANQTDKFKNTYNVCDEKPYSFDEIIQVFQKSTYQPNRPVVRVPLGYVKLATRLVALILVRKRKWILSCYDKLAYDLIFDNKKMLQTGFMPKHSIQSTLID